MRKLKYIFKVGKTQCSQTCDRAGRFGGKCLPKDSNALRVLAKELGVSYDLFDALQSDNARLRDIFTGKESDVETQDD